MMNVDPFWLNDRIVPSDANDPKEVSKLGQALSDVGEDVADRSRPAVTEAVRRCGIRLAPADATGPRTGGASCRRSPSATISPAMRP